MNTTNFSIFSESLFKIAAKISLAVGCFLMVSCDGGLVAVVADKVSDNNSSEPGATAPIAINGFTISLDDSNSLLVLTENSDTWVLVEESFDDGDTGTFTYEASGDTGTVVFKSVDGGVRTVALKFISESTGTYVISGGEQSESGSFGILDAKAPSSLAGLNINFKKFDVFPLGLVDELPISFSEDGMTFTFTVNDNSDEIVYTADYIYAGNEFSGNFEKLIYTETTNSFLTDGGETSNSLLLVFLTEGNGVWISINDFDFGLGTFEIISGP